ncbi:MAG: DUF559 domain-containing protein [Chloroflexi bacterium]|nr:DUF559 domain-containing protein [Chloroflexota bacterium]
MPKHSRGKKTAKTVYAAREQRHNPTPAEKTLWMALRGRRFAGLKFRRQHPFGPYLLDMFRVKHQLEVEADGSIHDDPTQIEHDVARMDYLGVHGIRVLRFTNGEIEHHLDQVLQTILDATHPPSPDAGLASGEGARG